MNRWLDVQMSDELSFPDGADVGRRKTASLVLMADGRQRTQGDVFLFHGADVLHVTARSLPTPAA